MNKTAPKTKAVAFFVVPNDYTRQLIEKKNPVSNSPLLSTLRAAFGGNISVLATETPMRDYQYLFMVCFEEFPGAEKKVFDVLNNRFFDITAGLNGGWSMEDARKFIQEAVLEDSGIVTCCIPMDRVDIF